MYDFTNKYICLVLTCDKPQYKERLDKHKHIYSQIHKAGFEVVFLYANNTNTDIHLIQNENGYYNLKVPTEEHYSNLAVKMYIAYSFFATQDIKVILKVDDDVYHIDHMCLELDYYEADYLGISTTFSIEGFCNSIHSNSYRKDKYKDIPIIITDDDISQYKYFFPGYFYWISKKSIQYIVESKYSPDFIGSEDVFVGLSLADKVDIKRFAPMWHDIGYIKIINIQ